MSRDYLASEVLHQQAGAMTPAEFAEREGLSLKDVRNLLKRGGILGASRHPLSNRWHIYPPAKLLIQPRPYRKREAPGVAASQDSAASLDLLPCGSAVAVEAGAKSGQSSQYAPQVEAEGIRPPASQQFDEVPQLSEPLPPAPMPEIYSCAKVRRACWLIGQAVAKRHAEGVRYLALSQRELLQVRHAVERERNLIRRLVGNGRAQIAQLRATDSLWQKLANWRAT